MVFPVDTKVQKCKHDSSLPYVNSSMVSHSLCCSSAGTDPVMKGSGQCKGNATFPYLICIIRQHAGFFFLIFFLFLTSITEVISLVSTPSSLGDYPHYSISNGNNRSHALDLLTHLCLLLFLLL